MEAAALTYGDHGAQRFRAAAIASLPAIGDALAGLPDKRPGIRLHGLAALQPLLAPAGEIGRLAISMIGTRARPVRAILFDKTEGANWSLGWHQDRTIAVAGRRDAPGFGSWTVKSGILHVAPPYAVLAGMVTLRLHLDPAGPDNAPLLVAPGSHRLGRIAEADIPAIVRSCGTAACEAEAGDIWLYATPILHASEAAVAPQRRRVLQVDYAHPTCREGSSGSASRRSATLAVD
jgi:hypothetical protein